MHTRQPISEPFVRYVPGEFCALVQYVPTGNTDTILRDQEYEQLYEAVRKHLSERFAAAQKRRGVADQKRDPLTQDLAADDDSLQYFAGADGVIQAFATPQLTSSIPTTDHRIVLPAPKGDLETVLCFYRLGQQPIHLGDPKTAADLPLHLRRTRDFVNLLYQDLHQQVNRDLGNDGLIFRVTAVTPNWILGAAQISSDSPGARPAPFDESRTGRWTFRFTDPPQVTAASIAAAPQSAAIRDRLDTLVQKYQQGAGASAVTVAVLDTAPDPQAVVAAAQAHPQNTLLNEIAGRDIIEPAGDLAWAATAFGHLDRYRLNLGSTLLADPDHTFPQADHGLFIAGIIGDIAPAADLHLIRVLNDYGLGDMRSIARVIAGLPARFLADDPDRRLIINLSLVADLPAGVAFLDDWLPTTAHDLRNQTANHADLRDMLGKAAPARDLLQTLHSPLQSLIEWLHSFTDARGAGRVLLVAAAGNDYDPFADPVSATTHRQEPRWPARYDRAFGVAAVGSQLRPAEYSNRGDASLLGNGVATFGGEAKRAAAGELPVIDLTPAGGAVDAVRGIFSAPKLPADIAGQEQPNDSGWVYWAGTSFATPIISALAALIWSAEPTLPPGGPGEPNSVIGRVLDYVSDQSVSADADRLDCPAIYARQEFLSS